VDLKRIELESNHRGQYKEHGKWVKPVFPSNISLQGSPLTPYIYDDRVQYEDAGNALLFWYKKNQKDIDKCVEQGFKYITDDKIQMTSKHMSNSFVNHLTTLFKKWNPKPKYTLEIV